MVEDRKVLEDKIKNFLKHLPCRGLKLESIYLQDVYYSEPKTLKAVAKKSYVIRISTTFNADEVKKIDIVTDVGLCSESSSENLSTENAHQIVNVVGNCIPETYKSLKVQNVKESLTKISYNFSSKNIPDNFYLVKLPYRQLALQTSLNEKIIFIDLCTGSYQKILAEIDSIQSWPTALNFLQVANNLKRKELVTLLLALASNI